LNWALEGLGRLVERGNRFTYLKAASEAVTLMRDLASPVAAFVRERCELGTDKEVSPELLYSTYKGWSDDNGHIKKDKATFGVSLRRGPPCAA
jgi:putative DNA primase/helicase